MTESLITAATALAPLSPIAEWHAHLDLQVRAGQMAKDTATTYRQGMRKLTEWASQQEGWNRTLILEWVAALKAEGKAVKTVSIWLTGARCFFQAKILIILLFTSVSLFANILLLTRQSSRQQTWRLSMLSLPTSSSPLRQLFDVATLAEVASPANRSKLPTFRQTVQSAKEFFASETSAKSLNAVTLRASGELWLVEVKRSGGWRKLWNFGQLSY